MLTRSLVLLVCQFRHFRISCYQALSLCSDATRDLIILSLWGTKIKHYFTFFSLFSCLLFLLNLPPGIVLSFFAVFYACHRQIKHSSGIISRDFLFFYAGHALTAGTFGIVLSYFAIFYAISCQLATISRQLSSANQAVPSLLFIQNPLPFS